VALTEESRTKIKQALARSDLSLEERASLERALGRIRTEDTPQPREYASLTLDDEETQQLLREAEERWGPIVPRDRLPRAYELVEALVNQLLKGQRVKFDEVAPDLRSVQTRVETVDLPGVANAFVGTRSVNPEEARSLVFVTTGLLKRHLVRTDAAGRQADIKALAGVLAHELSHPIDTMDSKGIGGRWQEAGKVLGAQALELRADVDAVDVARESNVPQDAVYAGVTRFKHVVPTSLAASMVGDHHATDLRLSILRLITTAERYERGLVSDLELPRINAHGEVAAFKSDSTRYDPPQDLKSAVDRVLALPGLERSPYHAAIEFNRLILSVDHLVRVRGEQLTPAEKDSLHALFTSLVKDWYLYPRVMSDLELRRELTEENGSGEVAGLPSHQESLRTVPFYRSEEHTQWVRQAFGEWWGSQKPKLPGDYPRGWPGAAQKAKLLTSIVAPEAVFSTFEDQLRDTFTEMFHRERGPHEAQTKLSDAGFNFSRRLIEDTYPSAYETMPVEMEFRLANLIWELQPALDEGRWVAHLLDPKDADGTGVIFPLKDAANAEHRGLGVLDRPIELAADPRKAELWRSYRSNLKKIWDNRGYYAALDLAMRGMSVDWETIMHALKIPKDQGESQIRSALKEFTRSEGYVQLLELINDEARTPTLRSFRGGFPMEKSATPSWPDNTLGKYLGGDLNPALADRPELRDLAQRLFQRSHQRIIDPTYSERTAQDAITAYLNRFENVAELRGSDIKVVEVKDVERSALPYDEVLPLVARAIDRSDWPVADKRRVLKELFVDSLQTERPTASLAQSWAGLWNGNAVQDRSLEARRATIETLKKHHLIDDHYDFLSTYVRSSPQVVAGDKSVKIAGFDARIRPLHSLQNHTEFADELAGDFARRFASLPAGSPMRKAFLVQFAEEILTPPSDVKAKPDLDNSPGLRRLKAQVLEAGRTLQLSTEESGHLFRAMTHTGPTTETDAFFEAELLPMLRKMAPGPELKEEVTRLVRSDSIASDRVKVELARMALEDRALALEKVRPSPEQLDELLQELRGILESPSADRDELLEELAWRLGIYGPMLQDQIVPLQSSNLKGRNPLWVNLGSALTKYVSNLPTAARDDLLEYLSDPQGALPPSFSDSLRAQIFRELTPDNPERETPDVIARRWGRAREAASLLESRLQVALADAKPMHRIPIFELVLMSGRRGDLDVPRAMGIARRQLGYVEGSRDDIMLKSFLETIRPHERSVTLSYMLAMKNEGEGSTVSMLELFHSVGMKFGQFASIWKIFGESKAEELKQLKSNAKKLPKVQHEKVLEETMTPGELAQLDLGTLRNVANASMKAVDSVELKGGGGRVAVLIRRPYAETQIPTDLALAKALVERVQHNGLEIPGGMTRAILESLGEQMNDELSMKQEARRLPVAKELFEEFNRDHAEEMDGWTFDVPQLAPGFEPRDNLLVTQFVDGKDLDHIPSALRDQLGPFIAEASMYTLFDKGWFNPDSHAGNFIVDEAAKKIWVMDLGQVAEYSKTGRWTSDDRFQLGRLVEAFDKSDVDGLLHHALQMTDSRGAPEDPKALRAAVAEVLEAEYPNASDKLIALMNALAEHGVTFKTKFSFGALKGLIILQGEHYVSDAEFERLLGASVERVLRQKAPRYLLDVVQLDAKKQIGRARPKSS
jgi:predicted unusual protein kinase regulating ubiquinone biosynthesis (AarF/ABC1/UbiB family)